MESAPKENRLSMRSFKLSVLDAFDDLRTGGFARPAAEKFGGAWLACFLVMARGNVFAAFSSSTYSAPRFAELSARPSRLRFSHRWKLLRSPDFQRGRGRAATFGGKSGKLRLVYASRTARRSCSRMRW
jgi:hypothetical protein